MSGTGVKGNVGTQNWRQQTYANSLRQSDCRFHTWTDPGAVTRIGKAATDRQKASGGLIELA
jgi:hypothetical protein